MAYNVGPVPFTSGSRLGPYELQSRLGAGGMGEVYKARDTRLRRDVAVKILPESFAQDSDRLLRFEQEAQAVAALNHPNILSVHDVGLHEDVHYIVIELLDGETLRDKLAHGPIPPRRAVDYAIQIARGLASAHERGIIHRDLKPENLFITKDGRVKILDFGLAKQITPLMPDSDAPTIGQVQTSVGVVLGTVGYMSPEQVRGQAADQRSDIFAFGTVLYEMLTAQRAFKGASSVETMNAILKSEPEELVRTGQVWPSLQKIVQHCLEKNPDQRFQSAQDLAFALETVGDTSGVSQALPASSAAKPNRFAVLSAILAILLVGAAALGTYSLTSHPPQPEFTQLTYRLGYVQAVRFTPDGQNIVYGASWDQPLFKLYNSPIDGSEGHPLDLPPAELLSVSHSSELAIAMNGKTWLGFGSRLARARMDGGAPRELEDEIIAADWSPGGQIAVARVQKGSCQVEYPIGTVLYKMNGWISHMRFAPQGDAIAFIEHPIATDDRGNISMVDLRGNKRSLTREWIGAQGLAWAPGGNEIWFTATADTDVNRPLYAVTRSGKQRVILRTPGGLYLEDIAVDGRVLLRRDERRIQTEAGQLGGESRSLSWREIMLARAISRDGKYALITDETGKDYGSYLRKLDGSPAVLLGFGDARAISPDGAWVTSIPPEDTTKILILPTGIGQPKTIAAPNFQYRDANWT